MNTDEREIFNYLQTWGGEFISVKEVCRRASTKKRYHEDPNWAQPLLQMMAERGLLERNLTGHYRIKPEPKKKHDGRWVSPEIKEILDENGVQVESQSTESDMDHGEQL